MSNRPVRFAMVGCGAITKKHLVSIDRLDEAELSAVCDIDEDAARQVGEEKGVPWFTNPHEMAQKTEFDVFSILTPSGSHAPVMLDLINYGRHFVVEKPLALRIEDADAVLQACDEVGAKIFVVKQNRYNPPVRKLKEAIDAGRMGQLLLGTIRLRWCRPQEYYSAKPWRGTWASDGGVFMNQASHHIDLLCWLMGDVESVMAMMATQLADIEAEDTGIALLRFTNGALGIIEATTATRPKDLEGSISVLGENGSVEIGGFFANEMKTWNFSDSTGTEDELKGWERNPDEWAWNHTEYLRAVVKSIQHGTKGLVDGLEGRRSLELINAIYESAETGAEVHLRFRPKFCKLGL